MKSIYKSLDLCCQPYLQKHHTGENILMGRTTFYFRLLLLFSRYSVKRKVLQNGIQQQNLKKGSTVGCRSINSFFLDSKTEEQMALAVS